LAVPPKRFACEGFLERRPHSAYEPPDDVHLYGPQHLYASASPTLPLRITVRPGETRMSYASFGFVNSAGRLMQGVSVPGCKCELQH
jgi:hypothetical protein